jgi:hypothetical protein
VIPRDFAGSRALVFWLVLSVLSGGLAAQQPPMFGSPRATGFHRPGALGLKPRTSAGPAFAPGQACQYVDFFGVQDEQPIQPFDGITSTGWVGAVSFQAQGLAEFAPPPGADAYAAVFLNGQTNVINFSVPVATVTYVYATYYNTTVTAYNAASQIVLQQSYPGNYDPSSGQNYYSTWSPVILQTSSNQISSISITSTGPPLNNFLGIDELVYCLAPAIDGVEFTQSIQQYQTIAQLQASLGSTGSPPVAMIAGKRTAMRVYTKTVSAPANLIITLNIPGAVNNQTKAVTVVPNCPPSAQRTQTNCSSTDFYFDAPAGSWSATLTVTDPSGQVQIEQDTFALQSVTTLPLELRAVAVCDDINFLNIMTCGTASNLSGLAGLLSKAAASNSVKVNVTGDYVFEDRTAAVQTNKVKNDTDWWDRIINWERNLYVKETGGQPGSTYPVYFGMVRDNLPSPTPSYSGLSHILSHEAAAIQSNLLSSDYKQSTSSIDVVDSTVAHETGHTLGLRHTNSSVPKTTDWPGCWVIASDPDTDWIGKGTSTSSPGDNHLLSSPTTIEVGFDVLLRKAQNPLTNSANGVTDGPFELMSYCYPRWIAPQRVTDQLPALTGSVSVTTASQLKSEFAPQRVTDPLPALTGSVSVTAASQLKSEFAPQRVTDPLHALTGAVSMTATSHFESEKAPRPHASGAQPFWIVTGSIPSSGPAEIDPIFEYTIPGDTSGGSGAYSLQVQSSNGTALFTQKFDLPVLIPEAGNIDEQPDTQFVQTVPVTAGAARIVLLDPGNAILTYVTLGGVAPTVAITNPTAAFDGTTPITWTITDPDSVAFASRVYYSPDNGTTWSEIGQVPNSGASLNFDFSLLPGTNGQGLIKVLVSDGVNTGQAISPNFSIAKKTPSFVQIASPTPNFAQPANDPVLFTGTAYDTDDGVLSGASLSWSSNLQGALGTGSPLAVSLQPGLHTITLTATDSDNNSISTTTTVTIGDQPPSLGIGFNVLSAPPSAGSTCLQATVTAVPGSNGAPVSSAQYSVDGGNTYTSIPVVQLPYTFAIPGTGFMNLVFTATDASNQLSEQTATYFNSGTCGPLTVPNVVGMTQANATAALGNSFFVVGATTMAASSTVAAGNVIGQNPSAGASIATGASDAVNLAISAGPQIATPNVVGLAQATASATITGAGLAAGTVTSSTSTTVPAGNVISQTPLAGTAANAGTAVNLVISTGNGLAVSAPTSLTAATIGYAYSAALTPSGGSGNYTWSATGLPSGLAIDNTGTISGTPSGNSGSANVQVTLTDTTYSTTAQRSYVVGINATLSITGPASLPNATVGAAYPATTMKATGGSGTYFWLVSGLPAGMILNSSTGVISGTPVNNLASPYTVQVILEDSNSVAVGASYSLTVNPALLAVSAPSVLPAGYLGTAYGPVTASATGGSGTYTWSATGLAPGLSIVAATGVIQGTPTSAAGSPFSVTVTVSDGNTTAKAVYSLTVSSYSPCDVYQTGSITVADVQSIVNQALGAAAAANDVNGDGVLNVVDAQIVINAFISGTCVVP